MSLRSFFRRLREGEPTPAPAAKPYLRVVNDAPGQWTWELYDEERSPAAPVKSGPSYHSVAAAETAGREALARYIERKNFKPTSYTIGKDNA